jgi:hypothetical protein
MKYHINQRVRIVGTSGLVEGMRFHDNALDETKARIKKVYDGYYRVWDGDEAHGWEFNESDLAPYEITWETLEPGVEIESRGKTYKIIDVLPNSFSLDVSSSDFDEPLKWYIPVQAQKYGWKIIQPVEDIEELTVEEISKRLGKTIKVVKK